MSKQQYSVSENLIRRLRHSRKYQLSSVLVVVVGLVGIYMVMTFFAPSNYGANSDSRSALDSRGESLRERFGLRASDTFNRLNFIVGRGKSSPEWVQPVLLPVPDSDARKSLPDATIFGSAEEQFIASLPEGDRQAVANKTALSPDNTGASNNDQDSEIAQPASTTPITRDPAVMDDEDFGETYGEHFDINNSSELLKTCIYERDT